MFKLFKRFFTKNLTEIPLFYINFNYKKYKRDGKKNSCIAHIHPLLKDDEYIKEMINMTIDYIRDNYDMEEV